MKVRKGNGDLLVVSIPRDVAKRMKLKAGDDVEFIYKKDDKVHYFVRAEDWQEYVSLSEISDRELYNRYMRGQLVIGGLGSQMIWDRIYGYVERTKQKVIEDALEHGFKKSKKK
ncbi:MAG: AbrB/MazE/SpoVT family DNA-binding domain-containing protein [Candidatus Anstonellales archaeon]